MLEGKSAEFADRSDFLSLEIGFGHVVTCPNFSELSGLFLI